MGTSEQGTQYICAVRVMHPIIDDTVESSFLTRTQEITLTLHLKKKSQAPRVKSFHGWVHCDFFPWLLPGRMAWTMSYIESKVATIPTLFCRVVKSQALCHWVTDNDFLCWSRLSVRMHKLICLAKVGV